MFSLLTILLTLIPCRAELKSLSMLGVVFSSLDFTLSHVEQLFSSCTEYRSEPDTPFPIITHFPSLQALHYGGAFNTLLPFDQKLFDQLFILSSYRRLPTPESCLFLDRLWLGD